MHTCIEVLLPIHTQVACNTHTHTYTLKTNMSAYSALHFSYFGWKVAMPPLRMLIGNALNLTFFLVLLVMRHNGFLSAAATFGFSADYRITCDALKSGRWAAEAIAVKTPIVAPQHRHATQTHTHMSTYNIHSWVLMRACKAMTHWLTMPQQQQ